MKTFKITINARTYWTEAENLSMALVTASNMTRRSTDQNNGVCRVEEFHQSDSTWIDGLKLFNKLPASIGIGLVFCAYVFFSIPALSQAINPDLPWTVGKSQYDNLKCYRKKSSKMIEIPCKLVETINPTRSIK